MARRDRALASIGFGGGQERKLRSGTAMTALAAGFAAAARVAVGDLAPSRGSSRRCAPALASGIASSIDAVVVNGTEPVSPAILNVTFDGCRADDLLLMLDAAGIDCSTGSASRPASTSPARCCWRWVAAPRRRPGR